MEGYSRNYEFWKDLLGPRGMEKELPQKAHCETGVVEGLRSVL
jgi:hypothetical protein